MTSHGLPAILPRPLREETLCRHGNDGDQRLASFTQLQLKAEAVSPALSPVTQEAKAVGDAMTAMAAETDQAAADLDKWATAAAKAAGTGEGFTRLIVEGSTALANMTKAQQDLVVSGGLQTQSFLDMGREVDSLVTDYLHASEALSEYTIATAAQTGSQEDAKAAVVETTKAIEDQAKAAAAAAQVVAQAQAAAASAFANMVSVGQSVAEQVDELLQKLGTISLAAPDVGGEFSFVENPALLAQIEALQHQIVDSSGQARIDANAQLQALLDANADQIEADRAAADLQAEFKQLDEERNASLTKLVGSSENLEKIAALQAQLFEAALANAQALTAAAATSSPAFQSGGIIHGQHGFVVPGTGRGDTVPALLEPGELVLPRDLTRELFEVAGHRVGTRGQSGGLVEARAGRGRPIQIIVQQLPAQSPQALVRTLVPALRREVLRGTV